MACIAAGCQPDGEAQARETGSPSAVTAGSDDEVAAHRAGRTAAPTAAQTTATPASDDDAAVDAAPTVEPIALEVVAGPSRRDGIVLTPPDEDEDDDRDLVLPVATHDVLDAMVDDRGRLVAVLRPGSVFIASDDGGRTWHSWVTAVEVTRLVADGRTWYGLSDVDADGSAHRLARSQDRGKTWELRLTGRSMQPHHPSMLIDAGDEQVMAVDRHVLVSDNAKKWRWQDPGFPELSPITAVTWLPGKSPLLVAGAQSGHVATRDRRGTWTTEGLPDTAGQPTGFARAGSGDLLASTTRGLFRRDASGWVAIDALAGRSLRGVTVAGDQALAYGDAGELARSTDGGQTWTRHTDQVLEALGFDGDARAIDALGVVWRHALPAADGAVVVLGDDLTVVRVGP